MALLTLAIPSKGRLKDNCNAWFAAAGVTMEQTVGARGYRASFAGFPDVEVMLLSAGEIASVACKACERRLSNSGSCIRLGRSRNNSS